MSYPIKFLSLQKAELEYEVALRGGTTTGVSVQDLRKQIVKLATLAPPEDILESHLDAKLDLAQIKDSLIKSKTNIDSLKIKFDKNLFTRAETLLHHLYYRLMRIDTTADIAEANNELRKNLNQQFKDLALLRQQVPQQSTSSLTDFTEDINEPRPSCDHKLVSEVVSKLKFSGKTCVRAFIQRAEEITISRGFDKNKLLGFAFEIFTDDALHWYRFNKDKFNSWNDVVTLLKRDFSKDDYNYRLLSEIRARTQGEKENITVYLSIMHGMFARLDTTMSDSEKLEILLHNIRPCYTSAIAASPIISSVEGLGEVCRSYESIQSRISQFREPPKPNADMVAPEFAYNKPSSSNSPFQKFYTKQDNNQTTYNKPIYNKPMYKSNYEQQQTNKYNVNAVSFQNNINKKVYCPRCRDDTHSLGQCDKPRYLICFKCGKKGVRFPDCPVCKPKSNTKN